MNNIEAARVMSVLDELLHSLRSVSLVTANALESAQDLEEVVELLMEHREATARLQSEGQNALTSTTYAICRALAKEPDRESQLQVLFQDERTVGMLELIAILEKVKGRTYTKLTTTMEEENSDRDHFEEVCRREEKAGKERLTLEQQLRVERRERSKQVHHMTGMESRATGEIDHIKTTSVQALATLKTESKTGDESDLAGFVERETFLMAEVEKLRAELLKVEMENRELELTMRTNKKKKEQEVLITLGEYDTEMAAKEKAYQDEKTVYEEVKTQLAEMEQEYKELQEEAEVAAEKNRKANEEKARAEEKERRLNKAATVIQRSWRAFLAAKGGSKKEEKKEKKGKGGKKK